MRTESVAIVTGGIVVVAAMLTGHDGAAIAAFFGLLAGLGLGRRRQSDDFAAAKSGVTS